MNVSRNTKLGVAIILVLTLLAGAAVLWRSGGQANRVTVTAYFDNSNQVFVGDNVRILGVPVGRVAAIETLVAKGQPRGIIDVEHDGVADIALIAIEKRGEGARFRHTIVIHQPH